MHVQAPIEVDNVLKHGANVIVILLDVLLCRTPFITYHFQACLLYGTLYTLFMWSYHAASLHWVYYILDWTKPEALLLYALNPLFLFASFAAWYASLPCMRLSHSFRAQLIVMLICRYGVACAREWLGSKLQAARPMTSLQWLEFQ